MAKEPAAALTSPVARDPIPDVLENAMSGSYVSPSYWLTGPVMQALSFAGVEQNPIDMAAEWFTGDWTRVQEAGQAVQSLGDFNKLLSEAITAASTAASEMWDGDAASAADKYFADFAQAIRRQQSAINQLGKQLDSLAFGMYEASQAFKGIAATITDLVIMLAIKIAAAFAASSLAATGIGAAVAASSWASATMTALQVADKVSDAITAVNLALQASQTIAGEIIGHVADLKEIQIPELPGRAYDNPDA
ncbi:hypothetical protein AAFP35_00650 [Gordonia sp. CPCC 206044]|uniref:hypothetical protein n=1 Tax=Gordonia sp. CPCC 206044 TaxID=3140793 RepID=UPI003AF3A324